MRKRIVIGLALGVGVLALSGFAWGWHHHRHDPARMAQFVTERVDDALDDVDATAEQREKIHAVKDRMLARAKERWSPCRCLKALRQFRRHPLKSSLPTRLPLSPSKSLLMCKAYWKLKARMPSLTLWNPLTVPSRRISSRR